jgi:hypothetical protein
MKGDKMNNKTNNIKTLLEIPYVLLFLAIIVTMIVLISFSLLISLENKPSATLHLVKTENGKVIYIEQVNSNNIK